MDGLQFLANLMRLHPLPVVMVSSLTEAGAEVTLKALELGAIDFVTKPKLDIARGLTDNYLAVSGGVESPEAAVTEALALLADGAPEVLVVLYDGPTPEPYAEYRDEPEAAWAWAWRIGAPRDGAPRLSLEPCAGPPAAAATPLPHGLDVLRFALAGEGRLVSPSGHRCWQRDA